MEATAAQSQSKMTLHTCVLLASSSNARQNVENLDRGLFFQSLEFAFPCHISFSVTVIVVIGFILRVDDLSEPVEIELMDDRLNCILIVTGKVYWSWRLSV